MTSILRAASAGCYLVAYPILSIHPISVGWMSSHGYDFVERDKDRNYVLSHALQDEDKQVSDPMHCCGCGGHLFIVYGLHLIHCVDPLHTSHTSVVPSGIFMCNMCRLSTFSTSGAYVTSSANGCHCTLGPPKR